MLESSNNYNSSRKRCCKFLCKSWIFDQKNAKKKITRLILWFLVLNESDLRNRSLSWLATRGVLIQVRFLEKKQVFEQIFQLHKYYSKKVHVWCLGKQACTESNLCRFKMQIYTNREEAMALASETGEEESRTKKRYFRRLISKKGFTTKWVHEISSCMYYLSLKEHILLVRIVASNLHVKIIIELKINFKTLFFCSELPKCYFFSTNFCNELLKAQNYQN